jgi:hypothetical protein
VLYRGGDPAAAWATEDGLLRQERDRLTEEQLAEDDLFVREFTSQQLQEEQQEDDLSFDDNNANTDNTQSSSSSSSSLMQALGLSDASLSLLIERQHGEMTQAARTRVKVVAAVSGSADPAANSDLRAALRVFEHIKLGLRQQNDDDDDRDDGLVEFETIVYNSGHDNSSNDDNDDSINDSSSDSSDSEGGEVVVTSTAATDSNSDSGVSEGLGGVLQMWAEGYNTHHLVDGFAMRSAWGGVNEDILLSEGNLAAILDRVRWALKEGDQGAMLTERLRAVRLRGGAKEMAMGFNTDQLEAEYSVVSVR